MTLHRWFTRAAVAAATLSVAGGDVRAQASYSTAQVVPFTEEQLDNLVAPIALYPDAILAQVLVAATFPDQIEFAIRYVRANGTRGIDDQAWDVSVKSVAHYLPVLNMLAERPDWTTALGQAYAGQSADVMDAVQRLRAMAHAQGNLVSTPEQDVIVERERIIIVPAQPRVIYVPTYDPWAVYYRPVFIATGYRGFWSFGIGFPIGAWLSYDCDWWGRRVYYDGWRGGGWRHYSRPYIHVTNVYVHPRYEVVYINRTVVHHTVNYGNLGRYTTVHRDVAYGPRGGPSGGGRGGPRDDDRVGRRDDDRNGGRTDGRAGVLDVNQPDRTLPAGVIRAPAARVPVAPSRNAPTRGEPSRAQPARVQPVGSGSGIIRGTSAPIIERQARPVAPQRSSPPGNPGVTTYRTQPPPVVKRGASPPGARYESRPVPQPQRQVQRPVQQQERPVQQQRPTQPQRPVRVPATIPRTSGGGSGGAVVAPRGAPQVSRGTVSRGTVDVGRGPPPTSAARKGKQ